MEGLKRQIDILSGGRVENEDGCRDADVGQQMVAQLLVVSRRILVKGLEGEPWQVRTASVENASLFISFIHFNPCPPPSCLCAPFTLRCP